MQTNNPKQISPRVSFQKSKDQLTVIISQQVEKWKETLLFTWLLAWGFCGMVFLSYLINSGDRNEQIFLIISVAVWAFFMVRIGKVYFWRRRGSEQIKIEDGKLFIKNAFGKRGKTDEFEISNIRHFGKIKTDVRSFLQSMDESFWVIGGERFGFDYQGHKIRFGKQLSEKEVTALGRVIEKSLREFGKRK